MFKQIRMKPFVVLFLFTVITSCHPNIEIINEINTPKLVVWCILHPDSIPTAYVSQTSPLLTKAANYKIDEAQVILFQNNIPVDTFVDFGKGIYKSSKQQKIVENNIYHITVYKNGF